MYARTRDALLVTLAVFLAGMVAVALSAAYWQLVRADDLARHPANPRTRLALSNVQRGGIYAENGEVLAWSELEGGVWRRRYRVSPGLSHIVGYADPKFGLSGLELAFNEELTGRYAGGLEAWWASVRRRNLRGADVYTTIRPRAQAAAEEALAGRRGAVVALDVTSGAVLASVSAPGFAPSQIAEDWTKLSGSNASPLLNRATQGLYPPGSAFKVLIALAAIQEGLASPGSRYVCPGQRQVDGGVIRDYLSRAHGPLDLTEATVVSCNYVYSGLGLELGPRRFDDACRQAGLFETIPFDLTVSRNRIPRSSQMAAVELAELGIGQGRLAVTPLAMARLVAIVARRGILIEPYVVQTVRGVGGAVIHQHSGSEVRAFSAPTAEKVAAMLREAVIRGTGRSANLGSISVAGKTGTAENPHGPSHAWFVAYAPADNPRVAVSVIVENGGSGGQVAAPIAAKVISASLSGPSDNR